MFDTVSKVITGFFGYRKPEPVVASVESFEVQDAPVVIEVEQPFVSVARDLPPAAVADNPVVEPSSVAPVIANVSGGLHGQRVVADLLDTPMRGTVGLFRTPEVVPEQAPVIAEVTGDFLRS